MEKKFKVVMPEQEIKPEIIEKKIRAMFSEDLERNGILAKVFVFMYENEPVSVSDMTKLLNDYYLEDFDRALVFRALKKLSEARLLNRASIGYVLAIPEREQKEIHKKCIERYHRFLSSIPAPFRSSYQDVNYFWIKNGEGNRYIEWCCRILNFKLESSKEDKKQKEV